MINFCLVKRKSPTTSVSSVISTQKKKKLNIFSAKAGIIMDMDQQMQTFCTADSNLDLDLGGIIVRQQRLLGQNSSGEGDGEGGGGKGSLDRMIGWCEFPEVEEGGVSGVWLVMYDGHVSCFNANR